MTEWTGDVQSRLDVGESLVIWPSAHIKVRSYADGAIEAVGFTMGSEPITLSVDGEARTYLAAGGALSIEGLEITTGLTIQGQRITINGINKTISDLQRVYDLNGAPVDVHDIAFTPGMQLLGYRRTFLGNVDSDALSLDDRTGEYSVVAVSALRRGTRTFDAVLDENRDPFFRYVASAEGDAWG